MSLLTTSKLETSLVLLLQSHKPSKQLDIDMSITVTGFGGTAPAPVLNLLTSLIAGGDYTSITAHRSQNIEYELLKAPHRTFFNPSTTVDADEKKMIVYNLPTSLAEYMASLDEVHSIRSACLKKELVVTYDHSIRGFVVDPTDDSCLATKSSLATLQAIAKLDAMATAHVSKEGDVVLLIGSGGREHALAVALANSPLVHQVICAPGNGGTSSSNGSGKKIINATIDGVPVNTKNETIVQLVKEYKVDMVVVGPEQPLVDGLVDCLKVECGGVRVFGPSKDAAELEASKVCLLM